MMNDETVGPVVKEGQIVRRCRDAATQQGDGGLFSVAGGFVRQGFLQFGKLGFNGSVDFPVGKIGDVVFADFPGHIPAGVGTVIRAVRAAVVLGESTTGRRGWEREAGN